MEKSIYFYFIQADDMVSYNRKIKKMPISNRRIKMSAIIAAVLFSIITILNILLILGLPLGEFTMGGQNKVLPEKLRIVAVFTLLIQIFAIIIVLQAGGYLTQWFSIRTTKILCFAYAVFLLINTFMNLISYSKKEKYTMTPLSLVSAICFLLTAIKM